MSVYERAQAARAGAGGEERDAGYRLAHMRELRAQVKRSALERVGFTEVARIIEGSDIERARTELRPAIEAVLNAGAATEMPIAQASFS